MHSYVPQPINTTVELVLLITGNTTSLTDQTELKPRANLQFRLTSPREVSFLNSLFKLEEGDKKP